MYPTVMRRELLSLTEKYDQCQLECDGMTSVIHTVLEERRIAHTVWVGAVTNTLSGDIFAPHLWITVDSLVIDYRARMWLGDNPDIPHGIFTLEEFPAISYKGEEISLPILSERIFKALTTW